ncbi:sensor histidine kinase [Polynucleobacter sp. es-MAR-4]|uniref:sensor histidine kinase n=1 Tax=Polynucleobacter sp. es-MAR-4 TaxID=1855655 RepID=UPI001C0BDEAD|nr:HAMP domain-containing sensor histidine kinase [Polynucleobacter sp. es-MAR-4]MBU3636067.1 HAMP domain-containing histidine kinase [Polynucleobacter sp. es-MAR-4]
MEQINQLIFIVYALVLLGILTSTLGQDNASSPLIAGGYWSSSLLLRASSLFTWAALPIFGEFLLDVANGAYLASSVTLCLLFRSWNAKINARLLVFLMLCWIFVMVAFHFLRLQPDSFAQRVMLVTIPIILLESWQIYELVRQLRSDKSFTLRILIVSVFLQAVLAFLRMSVTWFNHDDSVANILQQKSSIAFMFIANMSANLLCYVMVSSLLFQKLWKSASNSLNEILQKTRDLKSAQQEKEEMEELNSALEVLLAEKNQFVKKLTMSEKLSNMGTMVSSLAHEINQPLGAIRLNTDFLEQRLMKNGDLVRYQDILSRIQHDGERAANTITKLRHFFYSGSGEFELFNLSVLIKDVVAIASPEANSRKVSLIADVPKDAMVNGDPSQLQMVILNLLNNAMEALRANSGEKIVHIRLSRLSQSTEVEVIDNGPGVANVVQLFELFNTTKESGMGVGLWLSRSIMELHGGNITVVNPGEAGAIFKLRFPNP